MLVPLLLHLIRRRPPARVPLPTARFLSPESRSAVRLSRPTDLLLLALRMLLLLLAGAAFARPAWVPAAAGTSTIVLLDRGGGSPEGWRQGLGEARQALLGARDEALGELVVFDSTATRFPRRRVRAALFDSLLAAGPSTTASDYAAGLRALPAAAAELRGADSLRVRLLSAFRGGWSPGLAAVRAAAWPGA